MNEGYKKIFWGLIFANFHINLGSIQLLPSFVGYIIIYLGIETVAKEHGNNNLERSSKYCSILALMSFLVFAMQISMSINMNNITINILWSNIFSIIEMIMIYSLLGGSKEILEECNCESFKEYDKNIAIYLIGMTITTILNNINMIFISDVIVAATAIISITLTICILVIMRNIYKLDINIEED